MDTDYQLKYLEIIQEVIKRMAGNSFLIKGWAITVSLAGFGLFVSNNDERTFLGLVAFAAFIFWLLDAYYLKKERVFIKLYEKIASSKKGNDINSFSLNTSRYNDGVTSIVNIMFSFPTGIIYLAILAMTTFLYFGCNLI